MHRGFSATGVKKALIILRVASSGADARYIAENGKGKASTMSSEIVQFSRSDQSGRPDNNTLLDKAGQAILELLNKAADVAEQNSRQAIDTAQQLAHQLRGAEDRIAELEAEVEAHRQQAERAEQWLHKIYIEIEDRFLRRVTIMARHKDRWEQIGGDDLAPCPHDDPGHEIPDRYRNHRTHHAKRCYESVGR